jgi:hypothetical protein
VTAPVTVYAVITDKNGNIPPVTTKFGFTLADTANYSVSFTANEVPNSDGVLSTSINHPLNRGFVFPISLTKIGTPASTILTPTVDFTAAKNKSIEGPLTVR